MNDDNRGLGEGLKDANEYKMRHYMIFGGSENEERKI